MAAQTKEKLVEGAPEALRTRGFAGASARAIAGLAGVNPGLIFYYFGTLDELLVAALRESSEARLGRYREALEEVASPAELVSLLRAIYREDLDSGHIRVVCEMVSGSVARPEMGTRVMGLMEPWVDVAERAIRQVLGDSPVSRLVPPRDLAFAGVTFYVGANLVVQLGADPEAIEGLLAAAEQAAGWLGLLGPGAG